MWLFLKLAIHPSLCWFGFRVGGDTMFIEALLRRMTQITAPRLEKLDLELFKHPTVPIPGLF